MSAAIVAVFGPAPDGIDLSANNTPRDNAVSIAMVTAAVVTVALRVVTKLTILNSKLSSDDYLMIASLPPLIGLLVLTILAGRSGLGQHVWSITIQDVVTMRKILFSYIYIYIALLPIIKFSILMFYRNILRMRWSVWICMGICVGWAVSFIIAFSASCIPPSYYWTQFENIGGGKCVTNLFAIYIGNGSINIFSDFLVLAIPIPVIWKLQMRTAQKILVTSVFMLGGFACIASVVRLYYMTFLNTNVDVTWVMGYVFEWSTVEPCVGIICASLPTLQPLLRWGIRNVAGSTLGKHFGSTESKYQAYNLSDRRRTHSFNRFKGSSSQQHSHNDFALYSKNADILTNEDTHPIVTSAQAGSYRGNGTPDDDSAHDHTASITVERDIHWREERL